jgi:hypothetical protein
MIVYTIDCLLQDELNPNKTETVVLSVVEPMLIDGIGRMVRMYGHLLVCMVVYKSQGKVALHLIEKKS